MNGCVGMTSITLNLPFLRFLSLEGCSALTQVSTSVLLFAWQTAKHLSQGCLLRFQPKYTHHGQWVLNYWHHLCAQN